MIDMLFKTLKASYGDDLVGMATGGNELEVILKDKTVIIKDYESKTITEIIEEVNSASDD